MRQKIMAPLIIIVGVGLLFGGFSSLTSNSVNCGSKTMHSGDTCKQTSRKTGHTTRRSMSQQRDSNETSGWIMIGIGALMTVGGAVSAIGAYRRRPALPPPGGPGYYPPPGAQPYYPPPPQ